MELFMDVATEEEVAGISGFRPGSPQMQKLCEHLKDSPDDNAECMVWLYTLRGNMDAAVKALETLPEDRRSALKYRLDMVAQDMSVQQKMRKARIPGDEDGEDGE